jgi:RimJ/RimL family protein N-acetyltransferase
MDIAFKQIKTKNLRGYVMERNIPSWKVLEKSDFILEKTFEVEGLPDKIKSYLMTVGQYKLLQKR